MGNYSKYIINDYSPNYDYMLDGDKVYASLKGKNEWKDISHIEKARNNLYSFVRSKLKAPFKNDRVLTYKEIPTKNKVHIIDNYSPNYNYIVEGDKIYFAPKGKDQWRDISDNDKARTNLYNFLGNKYNFRGYEDDERDIWELIKKGTFNYNNYKELQNKPVTNLTTAYKPRYDVIPEVKPNAIIQPLKLENLVTVRVNTAGGGFMNIQVPEYMTEKTEGLSIFPKIKDEYMGEVNLLAYQKHPERYADPINNAANWLPFAILTGGRGLENIGFKFISPLVERMALNISNPGRRIVSSISNSALNAGRTITNMGSKAISAIGDFTRTAGNYLSRIPQAASEFAYSTPARQALTKATIGATAINNIAPSVAQSLKIDNPGSSEIKLGWNMLVDGDYINLLGAAVDYGIRYKNKTLGGNGSDIITTLSDPSENLYENHPRLDEEELMYMYPYYDSLSDDEKAYIDKGLNPFITYADTVPKISFTGDTIPVSKRRYIVPEVLDISSYKFKHRNRGQYAPIQSEAALITSFFPFVPYEKKDLYKEATSFIGYDSLTGLLKVGDISLFRPGDYLTKTYSNDIAQFKKDSRGNIIYKKAKGGNSSRSVPIVITTDGKTGSLNILTSLNSSGSNKGKTYGSISGGRVLVKVGDEFKLLSGSIEDIEKQFEDMKMRNNANYGTFYTLDNGSYNRALRTYDKQFTSLDLKEYDKLHRAGGGHFLYITE